MRVIAGIARSIQLETLPGDTTRPTTDRTKETLFNIIQYDVSDSTFLDLYSGSGSVGIEALSRGARQAVFVDNNPAATACINRNLKKTKLEKASRVLKSDALASISELDTYDIKFDIVFMDPPYNKSHEKDILLAISRSNIIHDNSIIIVEASLNTEFDYLHESSLEVYRVKKYKTSKHVFVRNKISP